MPEGFNLQILEEDPDYDMTILLPPMLEDELSDDEMDQVAGGGKGRWKYIEGIQRAQGDDSK